MDLKDNSKATMLEVVQLYYDRYQEYEKAYNNSKKENLQEKLVDMVKEGVDPESKEFENIVVEFYQEEPAKAQDVKIAATKFYLAAYFYNLTSEKPLPEQLKSAFDISPIPEQIKPFYAVEKGELVPKENIDKSQLKDNIRAVYQALLEQYK